MATAKNKAVAKKEEQPRLLSDTLFREAEGLKSMLTKVVAEDDDGFYVPQEQLGMAVNLIAMGRSLATTTTKAYKEKLAEITKPVDAAMKQIALERKAIEGPATEVAKAVEQGLQRLVRSGVLTSDGFTSDQGVRLSLIGSDTVRIIDADAVPDEFLLPREQCIDRAKLLTTLKAAKEFNDSLPAGTSLEKVQYVPGAELDRSFTFRTKLPEEVE